MSQRMAYWFSIIELSDHKIIRNVFSMWTLGSYPPIVNVIKQLKENLDFKNDENGQRNLALFKWVMLENENGPFSYRCNTLIDVELESVPTYALAWHLLSCYNPQFQLVVKELKKQVMYQMSIMYNSKTG